MKRQISFEAPASVDQALDVVVAALEARQPGLKVSRSDAMRIAIVSLAATVQRVAKTPLPTPEGSDHA